MVGPGALKPKVGDGIKSRRPLSAPVLHSFFVLCLLLHLYWCVYNNNNNNTRLPEFGLFWWRESRPMGLLSSP